ncbi:MAG: hypothetical protein JWN95_1633 [Frankiales bacterium]|nr:hypothetical protein [Frankiales bacterium]
MIKFELPSADLTAAVDQVVRDRQRVMLSAPGSTEAIVLIRAGELAAIEASLAFYATKGAQEATAEGIADLHAGRSQPWLELRTDYGRGPGASPEGTDAVPQPSTAPPGTVDVSHRARWDLDLLPAAVSGDCLDLLDALIESPADAPAWARLHELRTELQADLGDYEMFTAGGVRLVAALDVDRLALRLAHIVS